MWPTHGKTPQSGMKRHQQMLHPVSGQPVAYPPSQALHPGQGSVYINKSYDSGSKDRGRRVPNQELIVIDYADHRDNSQVLRDPVQLVDLNSREEVSITGQHPALYLHHPDQAPPVHPIMTGRGEDNFPLSRKSRRKIGTFLQSMQIEFIEFGGNLKKIG